MPKINLSKFGFASVAAATGVIMSIAPVFAQTTPTAPQTGTGSVITVIIDTMTFKIELSAQAAAELAAELAAKQAELAAKQAELVAEVGTANDVDDGNVEEELDVDEDADHKPTATATTATTTHVVKTMTVSQSKTSAKETAGGND